MTELRAPATGKYYRLSQICRVWRLPRSQYYAQKKRALENPTASESPKRRGPLGAGSDAELSSSLRELISQSNLFGEGDRKLWARLRFKGIRDSGPSTLPFPAAPRGPQAPAPAVERRAIARHPRRLQRFRRAPGAAAGGLALPSTLRIETMQTPGRTMGTRSAPT
jgi:hypothetical protein